MTSQVKVSRINEALAKCARLVHPSYPGHAWQAVFKGRQTRVAIVCGWRKATSHWLKKNDWLANEIMSASFVCQRTHVMEIKKATRKKPLLSGILSGSILHFLGDFFFNSKIQHEFDRISTKFANLSNSPLPS